MLIPKKKKEIGMSIIIDIANLAFRAAHTFKGIMFKISKDNYISSGIVYKVFDSIFKLYYKYNPSAIYLVFEGDKENNPRMKHPEYKSKRPTTKTIDITSELILIRELSQMLGLICIVPKKGEADDGIAVAAHHISNDRGRALIVSNDHDMHSLLSNRVSILKSNDEIMTKQSFIKKFGFPPKKFSLFLAVDGDASDNLLGVRGIGEKKCTNIFNMLYERKCKINRKNISKSIHNIKRYKDTPISEINNTINRYYKITRLHPEWPISILIKTLDIEKVKRVFTSLQMKQFITQMPSITKMASELKMLQAHNSLIRINQ